MTLDEREGVRWTRDAETGKPRRNQPRTSEREIGICGRCHSRRSQLTDEVTAADSLHDGFCVALLEPGLYWPDGQMRDEVFNYGSFLQSRMHAAGVTCGDCHEPHGGRLRADNDGVCLQCHESRLATPAHHFHSQDSAGARCAACHMPAATYMIIDVRHDHSFRIPRPDHAASLGTPDVCASCHRERGSAWAAAQIRRHHPRPNPGFQAFGESFAALERGDAGAAAGVASIAADVRQPPIVRASALARLGGRAAYMEPSALLTALQDPSPLVRRAAIRLAVERPPSTLTDLLPLLRDAARSVRLEAAAALAGLPPGTLDAAAADTLSAALEEYVASERFNADRPESLVNLGSVLGAQGDLGSAQRYFDLARRRDPGFLPAYVNLADVYRASDREREAEEILRAALAHAGPSGSAHHALALSLVRQKRLAEALPLLREAAAREPGNSRYAYVYAVALHESGQRNTAITVLRRAAQSHPEDADIAAALASFSAGREN